MHSTSGVGVSDLAFQKSITLRASGPYLTFSSVIESKRFDSLYKQIDLAPEEFKKLVNEEVENNAATDKAPSTHTSPVVPVTTPGTKPILIPIFHVLVDTSQSTSDIVFLQAFVARQ